MHIPGTEMNIITFSIIIVELAMLCFQIIHFLSRPSDKSRLWFLILLYLLIQYNIVSGLIPDPNFPLSVRHQHFISYFAGFVMSVYLPFYIYKAFDLKQLRFFAYWGSLLFIFMPFLLIFITVYTITDDFLFSRRMVVIIPLIYAVIFYYFLIRAVRNKYFKDPTTLKEPLYKEKILAIFTALTCWIAVPVILVFENAQDIYVNSFANTGLLIMTLIYIRSTIYNAKAEYNELQTLNKRLTEKVKERTLQLEKINEEKTNTFINLAHETKTPLTLIQNYLEEYINKTGYTEELRVIQSNINKLTNDIVNFFDMERFNKGVEVYDHEQITNFSELLNNKLPVFKSYAKKKGVQITEDIEQSIYTKAAPEALSRIANNLIDNAIKYSPHQGQVHVALTSKHNSAHFSVIDDGEGIPVEAQEKIFTPYYQINNIKSNVQGMGMGLSIVKKIIDTLDGKIVLKSDPDKKPGTKVTTILPLYNLQQGEVADTSDNSDLNHLLNSHYNGIIKDVIREDERPHIMVVEDNTDMLSYLVNNLGNKYNVYAAKNGKEALNKLGSIQHLDLIISDIMMDQMNGFEFLNAIAQSKKYQHLPFIFLTAKNNQLEKLYGLKQGAIDYISKPFNIRELMEKTDSVLENLNKQRKAIVDNAYKSIIGNAGTNDEKEDHADNGASIINDDFGLTTREKEIVQLIYKGLTQKTIAENLHISNKTVSKHIQNIYAKVDVTNKMELFQKLELIS